MAKEHQKVRDPVSIPRYRLLGSSLTSANHTLDRDPDHRMYRPLLLAAYTSRLLCLGILLTTPCSLVLENRHRGESRAARANYRDVEDANHHFHSPSRTSGRQVSRFSLFKRFTNLLTSLSGPRAQVTGKFSSLPSLVSASKS